MTSFYDVKTNFLVFWVCCQLWFKIVAEIIMVPQKPGVMLKSIVSAFRIWKQNWKIFFRSLRNLKSSGKNLKISQNPQKILKNCFFHNFFSNKAIELKLSPYTHNSKTFQNWWNLWRHIMMTSFCDVMTDFLFFLFFGQLWFKIAA